MSYLERLFSPFSKYVRKHLQYDQYQTYWLQSNRSIKPKAIKMIQNIIA